MRWYKHYTDSLDDPFIQELLDKHSHLGYAVWFGLIEIICKETGKDLTQKFECSPTYLRRKLRTSQAKLREVLESCRTGGRLLVTFSQEKWEFQIPKIAEIKDNYTKDLQASGKKLSIEKEEEKEVKNKSKKKTKADIFILPDFIPKEAWNGFVEMRKKIKAPMTDRGIKLAVSELEKLKEAGEDIEKVLDQSTMKNYKGLFPVKKDKTKLTRREEIDKIMEGI